MTDSANSNRTTNETNPACWASKIAARYQCELSSDLVDWFDSELWDQTGSGEYREPIHPSELLCDDPEAIWPALMPCDLLPISGNTAGDWLCIRIGKDDSPVEVVQWYHGGGDWIPWGRSLAEAFVFDALSTKLPGPLRRHSVPAENPRLDADSSNENAANDPLLQWATKYVPPQVADLLQGDVSGTVIAKTLLHHGVAEVAVRCEAVLDALHQKLTPALSPKLAEQWNVAWEEMVEWTFDARRIPADRRVQLQEHLGHSIDDEQDWATAQLHCHAVTQIAPNLAWPWEILGYVAERNDVIQDAMTNYTRGARLSVFTDQSVRLRTHWATSHAAKFSAARLQELAADHVSADEYLRRLCVDESQHRRSGICEYWRQQAATAREEGRFDEAYDCEMAAGWDLGAEPMRAFGALLESISESAMQAGQRARAKLAGTHRACLASRYGI